MELEKCAKDDVQNDVEVAVHDSAGIRPLLRKAATYSMVMGGIQRHPVTPKIIIIARSQHGHSTVTAQSQHTVTARSQHPVTPKIIIIAPQAIQAPASHVSQRWPDIGHDRAPSTVTAHSHSTVTARSQHSHSTASNHQAR